MIPSYTGLGAAATPSINIGTKMTALDGVMAGEVIARGVDDGNIVAVVKADGCAYIVNLQTMVDHDGDKWTVVLPEKTVYINVYDDGTCGLEHNNHADAAAFSKYYKTRIGIITKVVDDSGNIIRSQMNATTPQFRSPLYPDGMNPYAKG